MNRRIINAILIIIFTCSYTVVTAQDDNAKIAASPAASSIRGFKMALKDVESYYNKKDDDHFKQYMETLMTKYDEIKKKDPGFDLAPYMDNYNKYVGIYKKASGSDDDAKIAASPAASYIRGFKAALKEVENAYNKKDDYKFGQYMLTLMTKYDEVKANDAAFDMSRYMDAYNKYVAIYKKESGNQAEAQAMESYYTFGMLEAAQIAGTKGGDFKDLKYILKTVGNKKTLFTKDSIEKYAKIYDAHPEKRYSMLERGKASYDLMLKNFPAIMTDLNFMGYLSVQYDEAKKKFESYEMSRNILAELPELVNAYLQMAPGDKAVMQKMAEIKALDKKLDDYKTSGAYQKYLDGKGVEYATEYVQNMKPGELDAELNAVLYKRFFVNDPAGKGKFTITSNGWNIKKNEIDIPVYETIYGCVLLKENGECFIQHFSFTRDYIGGGVFDSGFKISTDSKKMKYTCQK